MSDELKSKLLHEVSTPLASSGNKVTIVGVGQVGMACAFSILSQGISNEIALVDCVADKLQGEMLDLQHGAAFLKHATVAASTDYAVSEGSRLCIITAGARQREGESRLDLVQRNTDILKGIVPQLIKFSPDCVILVVSNPVDILTHVAWRLSGLPRHRVLGSGTNLDSSRFRFLLSKNLGVAASSVHGWVVGEHGDSSVAVWSGVNVAGVRLRELAPQAGSESDTSDLGSVHEQVVRGAYEVIKLKGYTSWAVGLSVAALTSAILKNAATVHAVSTHIKGLHGVEKDVCLSLPAVLGADGVTHVVQQRFTEHELDKLHKSAELMAEVQDGLTI